MMRMLSLLLAATLLTGTVGSQEKTQPPGRDKAEESATPTIAELVDKLHAPRAGVVKYEVVVDSRQAEQYPHPYIFRAWRDGARYRADHLNRFQEQGAADRHIDCTNGPEMGLFFVVKYDATFDKSKAASMHPLNWRKTLIDSTFKFEDLGATPEPILNQRARGLKWYLDREEWTEKRVERTSWKGLAAYKIVLGAPKRPQKLTFETVLVPERGWASVSSRLTWDQERKHEVRSSESELTQVAKIWLPAKHVYTEYTDAKQTAKLTEKIEYPKLNESPDAKVFTLEGMGLIRGTLVSTEKQGIVQWDGTKLVPASIEKKAP